MLALIAGQGALPALLYQHLGRSGMVPVVAELAGFEASIPEVQPIGFRVEQLGTLLEDLKDLKVTEVCFAGRIARPRLDPAAIDAKTMPFVARIVAAIQAGDDGALRVVLAIFEEAGFKIRAVQDVMPELLPDSAIYTKISPGERDAQDAERGAAIITALSSIDTGQSCVVAAGQALAIEALGGTDWMLHSLGDGRRPDGPTGGILYKAAKQGQDRRVDLPVVGPETVTAAKMAGLSGIVVEAGSVMVLDLESVQALADQHGLFFWVREKA
ncbi:MAG: LpxI family protein [Paracoccaceae bacterium]